MIDNDDDDDNGGGGMRGEPNPPPPPALPAPLPELGDRHKRYAGCCANLSTDLLETIYSLLHDSGSISKSAPSSSSALTPLILSVGSGTGLLEELLQTYILGRSDDTSTAAGSVSVQSKNKSWRVEGVEVDPSVNLYIPEDRMNHVPGTWATHSSRARDAAALLFVYPRDGALLRRYVDEWLRNTSPSSTGQECATVDEKSRSPDGRVLIWLGPKADWDETGLSRFDGDPRYKIWKTPDEDWPGLADYEMLGTLRLETSGCCLD